MPEPQTPTTENPFQSPTKTSNLERGKASRTFIALAIVNGLSVLASGFILAIVAPNFLKMFEEFGIELPLLTQLIFRVSESWPVMLCLFLIASLASLIIHKFLWKKKRGLAVVWFFIVAAVWALWFVMLLFGFGLPWAAI